MGENVGNGKGLRVGTEVGGADVVAVGALVLGIVGLEVGATLGSSVGTSVGTSVAKFRVVRVLVP